jgi:hypothetical protein
MRVFKILLVAGAVVLLTATAAFAADRTRDQLRTQDQPRDGSCQLNTCVAADPATASLTDAAAQERTRGQDQVQQKTATKAQAQTREAAQVRDQTQAFSGDCDGDCDQTRTRDGDCDQTRTREHTQARDGSCGTCDGPGDQTQTQTQAGSGSGSGSSPGSGSGGGQGG